GGGGGPWGAADRRPPTVSTGIRGPPRRAVRANLRGLPNDSTYRTASFVWPSCSHQVSMSLLDTSYLSPTEANEDTPMPSFDRCSSSEIPISPDWTTSPAAPGAGWLAEKVASSPNGARATPKQLGPPRRMPYLRHTASRSGPPAPRPDVITTRERTPRCPQRCATSTTAAAGTARTARSTCSGRSSTDFRQCRPSRELARGLTG